MTQVLTPAGMIETLADLLEQLGGIAPERVRFRPSPGTGTEQDVLDIHARKGRLCELVYGVLVEKGMGFRKSCLVVEVLSESNTRKEMTRKRHEYFAAGVRLAWFVNPATRTVDVYTTPTGS